MKRIAVLGISLEANTFSTVSATMSRMAAEDAIHRGQGIVDQYIGSTAILAGFLDPDIPDGVEMVPLVNFRAGAVGAFDAETFDAALADMTQALRDSGPFDGVLLALHGAAVAENAEYADAETARRVRAEVGPDRPIGVVLDMHANVGQELIDQIDVLRLFQTNPHIDARDQALECRAEIIAIVSGAPSPKTVIERLPLIVNIVKQDTDDEPMASLLAHCRKLEQRDGIVDVSIAEGFPYADVEQMGMAVIASHRDDAAAARAAAREVAARIWAARDDLQAGAVSINEALERVRSHAGDRPILLLDVGDNVGGGSCGDSTSIVNAAEDLGVGGIAMTLWDPGAVAELSSAAIGDRVHVAVGGRTPEQEGHPQVLDAVLSARSDGRFEDHGPTHGGFSKYNVGPTVALRTDSGNAIVVTTHPSGNTSAELLRMVDVEPAEFAAVVGKGVNSPKAGYGAICGEFLMVDTPGVTRLSVDKFMYRRRRRPMYPFETDTTYP